MQADEFYSTQSCVCFLNSIVVSWKEFPWLMIEKLKFTQHYFIMVNKAMGDL